MEEDGRKVLSQEEASSLVIEESFVLQQDWQRTSEARGYINTLLKRNKRRTFGFLESPLSDPSDRSSPVLFRRLFLMGKAGVGKTSTVHRLLGRDIPVTHDETLGIQISTLYWPVKVTALQRVVMVKLELWDVGERGVNRFDHILPTCKRSTDGVLFFFSYTDRHSWETLPELFRSVLGGLPTPDSFSVVIGTHADCPNREVTESELKRFQRRYKIMALPIANVNSRRHPSDPQVPDGRAGIEDTSLFMNALIEVLLAYEKRKVMSDQADREPGFSPIESLLNTLTTDTEHS